ncbi:heterokaryon incompatibility protein-domain-containing protein [Pisolithus sp. B1]|nr:heterokaryon incompatibility protein-domain-containing protein [Pisolithus sp. B1]
MPASESDFAKLCEVCSRLDIRHMSHPHHPCRKPLPCSTAPIQRRYEADITLGSVDEIKSRRLDCDLCQVITECLDKEPSDVSGTCRMTQSREFCTFNLPRKVKVQDHRITHFHLTQASVIFDTSIANQFQGPSLPWELKERDSQRTHYILRLQARARSCVAPGDPAVDTPQTEQESLATIGGRYVPAQVNTHLIRAWLHQCESDHGKGCRPSLPLSLEQTRVPTFVIDVIQSCLVYSPSQCRYVALSYVWGAAAVYKHLRENTQDLRKTGSLLSLPIPATIRDAMTLTHAIGERYLWVDSLCIIQNDLEMLQSEITRMGSIYSKALFAIIAASGDSADSGLPGVEQGSREQLQKTLRFADCELLSVIDMTQSGIDDTPWAQRAWTFQERILSNRILVFSESQVYWSCRAAAHSEERALEGVKIIERIHLPFPQKYSMDCLSWKPLQPSKYRLLYDDLLSNYRQRRLSYQTDMLNAFNGVSEILAALQDDTFFWGLPGSLFSYAMTWNFTGHSARNHVHVPIIGSKGLKEMVPIPSWSWAAWSGEDPNHPPFLQGGGDSWVRPVIDFYLVDTEHQLVSIKEWPRQDHPDNGIHASWREQGPHQLPSLTHHSLSQVGRLSFWTSLVNVRAARRWRLRGLHRVGGVEYTLSPPSDFRSPSHYHSEIVQQDFIVVAAGGARKLVLLAIEWEDGVAYRVGTTYVDEATWVRMENRQWRLITLG